MDELRLMGLPRYLLDIAEQIGVDHFLVVWRRLNAEPSCRADNGMLLVTMRPYSSYLRFQRNRFIETLSAAGYSPHEIRAALQDRLGETISLRHISRLVRQQQNKP